VRLFAPKVNHCLNTTNNNMSTSETATTIDWHERIKNFYLKYDPAKVNNIDHILLKFKGDEETLMEALISKYGPEPPAEPKLSWLDRLCEKHDGFSGDLPKEFSFHLNANRIDQDLFYSLTEQHCLALLNAPLGIRIKLWDLIKKETGKLNESEQLREENLRLRNEIQQLTTQLQAK
jgi:hypothetical protein